ncbi:MarR family winged helix-turn-helix transcriptional regulator [Pseudonocardia acaciae]|uniref:MarR family winged helix-turn-helix transcriptional regulator n=1 Tax=Pseudonocardia acaciae TaxID=551276 RepID=UPI000687513C|nr:MarR family transcriptional regulator [Pseudonocardia acaciae]
MTQVDRLVDLMREHAGRTLMFHQAVTERVGLGPTDMKALDLARSESRLTAGRLAQVTGLSTSATTAVLDRLERRGFVERRRDPADRRKVVVVATGRHDEELGGIFATVEADTRALLAEYSEDELALITGFLTRLNSGAERLTRMLTTQRE